MATDAKKMLRLVQERTAYGVPKDAPGVCTMQDEDGNPRIKLGLMPTETILRSWDTKRPRR